MHPNSRGQSFEEEKDSLLELLRSRPLSSLSNNQLDFLGSAEILEGIGENGANKVEEVLYKNVIDVATSVDALEELQNGIERGIQRFDHINNAFEGILSAENKGAVDKVVLRVCFTGNASMNNISDFRDWGKKWYEIGRGIAMAHDMAPEDVQVVGASTGSIVIELGVDPQMALTAGAILTAAIHVAEKVLAIRKQIAEIKALNLGNKKIEVELEKEAEAERKRGVKKIVDDAMLLIPTSKDQIGEKSSVLGKAADNIIQFVARGGGIDFVVPDDSDDADVATVKKLEELRVIAKTIRIEERKIALLEYSECEQQAEDQEG